MVLAAVFLTAALVVGVLPFGGSANDHAVSALDRELRLDRMADSPTISVVGYVGARASFLLVKGNKTGARLAVWTDEIDCVSFRSLRTSLRHQTFRDDSITGRSTLLAKTSNL